MPKPKKREPEEIIKVASSLRKKDVDESVLEMARERIAHTFDIVDEVSVMFSGGKDSTVVLNLVLEEARRRGSTPVDVIFIDEEAIPPETIEYVERVASLPEVSMRWYCIPVKHRNGCSRESPYWYPWAPEDEELWCRPLPARAITELPGFKRESHAEINHLMWPKERGKTVASMMGIRADESMRRRLSVSRRVKDNYLSESTQAPWVTVCKPIYDWRSADVWKAPQVFGWDYNHTYDKMEAMGVPFADQRVAPPYGEEPMQRLWQFQIGWPELWDKMCERVPGAATAARYSQTDLYNYGKKQKPDELTWREMIAVYLERHPAKTAAAIAKRIKREVAMHFSLTNDPIPEEDVHPSTGVSWKWLALIASRGDLKGRKMRQKSLENVEVMNR